MINYRIPLLRLTPTRVGGLLLLAGLIGLPGCARTADDQFDPVAAALAHIDGRKTEFGLQLPLQELRARSVTTDDLGMTHVRLDQQYNNLPVLGGEMLVHFSAANELVNVQAQNFPTPAGVELTPTVTDQQARQAAARSIGLAATDCADCPVALAIFVPTGSGTRSASVGPRLVYQVDAGVSQINSYRVSVDAQTQSILNKTPLAQAANR